MLLKASFPVCILRVINGVMNIWMISPSRDGKQALIIRFDHVDLKKIAALSSEKPAEVTN